MMRYHDSPSDHPLSSHYHFQFIHPSRHSRQMFAHMKRTIYGYDKKSIPESLAILRNVQVFVCLWRSRVRNEIAEFLRNRTHSTAAHNHTRYIYVYVGEINFIMTQAFYYFSSTSSSLSVISSIYSHSTIRIDAIPFFFVVEQIYD